MQCIYNMIYIYHTYIYSILQNLFICYLFLQLECKSPKTGIFVSFVHWCVLRVIKVSNTLWCSKTYGEWLSL
jgi:hypothetical protein